MRNLIIMINLFCLGQMLWGNSEEISFNDINKVNFQTENDYNLNNVQFIPVPQVGDEFKQCTVNEDTVNCTTFKI